MPAFLTRIIGPARRHPWRSSIIGVVVLLVVLGIVKASKPKAPEYITAVSTKGNLTRAVEAVGTVISEKDLKLQFPVSGIVAQVDVQEGDRVHAGQRLAALRSADLAASVAVQVANLRSAQAQLQAQMEGSRPEDIAIVEADVANKRAALEAARESLKNAEESLRVSDDKLQALEDEAKTGLSGQIIVARNATVDQLTIGQSALSAFDDVFANNDVLDAVIKGDAGTYSSLRQARIHADASVRTQLAAGPLVSGFEDTLLLAQSSRAALSSAASVLAQAFDFISSIQTSAYLTTTSKEAYKTSLDTQWRKVQTAVSTLDSASKALSDAAATFTTRIASEKSTHASAQGSRDRALADIRTYETAVQTAEAQLALKRAPSRPTDIASAQARVQQAAADLQRVRAQLANTVLTAPLDGIVTAVNVKVGEALPSGPAVTMLGLSPYRIEMFVSEIDIPTVQLTQSGAIELDAFKGTHFKLRVSQIDTAATSKEGVSKYRIKLDFVYPHDELKVGMTGDAEIVTGSRSGAILVPRRAVLVDESGKSIVRVLGEDGVVERRQVSTGMEGQTGDIEVTTGLKEGETVIVLEKS